jgi:hypothetical protein
MPATYGPLLIGHCRLLGLLDLGLRGGRLLGRPEQRRLGPSRLALIPTLSPIDQPPRPVVTCIIRPRRLARRRRNRRRAEHIQEHKNAAREHRLRAPIHGRIWTQERHQTCDTVSTLSGAKSWPMEEHPGNQKPSGEPWKRANSGNPVTRQPGRGRVQAAGWCRRDGTIKK